MDAHLCLVIPFIQITTNVEPHQQQQPYCTPGILAARSTRAVCCLDFAQCCPLTTSPTHRPPHINGSSTVSRRRVVVWVVTRRLVFVGLVRPNLLSPEDGYGSCTAWASSAVESTVAGVLSLVDRSSPHHSQQQGVSFSLWLYGTRQCVIAQWNGGLLLPYVKQGC